MAGAGVRYRLVQFYATGFEIPCAWIVIYRSAGHSFWRRLWRGVPGESVRLNVGLFWPVPWAITHRVWFTWMRPGTWYWEVQRDISVPRKNYG